MLHTQLYADPDNVFVHDAVQASCRKHPPGVFIDGRKAFKYRMDEQEFLRKLVN